jgi:hypothetical protein
LEFVHTGSSGGAVIMTNNWTCPGCAKVRRSQFCPRCGEERLRAKDLMLGDVVAQFANRMTNVDGKLLRSSRAILTRPGTLTAAYVRGERHRYLAPLSLFLLANALFFGVQALTRTDVLSTPLASHLQVQDWKGLAQSIVSRRLQTTHETVSGYAPRFDQAARFNAKALMILMVLAFAPILPLLFRAPRRAAGAHVVFALHLYAFVLVLLCVSIAIAEVDLLAGGGGLGSPSVDALLSLFNMGACAIYLFLAIGPAYGASGGARYALAAILAVSMAALFVGYRFVIFLITLYGTT